MIWDIRALSYMRVEYALKSGRNDRPAVGTQKVQLVAFNLRTTLVRAPRIQSNMASQIINTVDSEKFLVGLQGLHVHQLNF